ncbi:MAG: hypothetical protein A2Z12_05405 [Actinobacteria bacterium RBG_16_68_21]|nr:MAG: hypothetical protein A2Z12_05405 [Actinobacteria bacterium RBG_16_68_21]
MRRTSKIAGVLIGIGAGVVAVVWMLRDRLMGPEILPSAPPRPPVFRVVPTSDPHSSVAGDDLTLIRGIGPAYRARLAAAGINRFVDLVATPAARVAEAAGVPEARAIEWIDLARRLTD